MLRAMRPLPLIAAALFAFGPAGFAQSTKPAAGDPVPAAPAAGEEKEATIPGVTLNRPDGRFLGVETEGLKMKITFYDAKKKPEAADVVRISARWTDTQPRFTVLLPESAETLVSPGMVRRPYNYLVFLALVGADDKVKETYSLRLQ